MKKIFSLALVCSALVANAQIATKRPAVKGTASAISTTKLVETVEKKTKDEIAIPYKKYLF